MAELRPADQWSQEEKENLAHFRRTLKVVEAMACPDKQIGPQAQEMAYNRMLRKALHEANAVSDKVLAKAHPGLPAAFREKLVRMLELVQQIRDGGKLDHQSVHETVARVTALGEAWDNWWSANGKDVRVPYDVPD
jgi:hypothetical protein